MELLRAIKTDQANLCNEFEDLVDAFGDPVYRFCRSLAYSKVDADDLFQETFLKAFGQMQKARKNPRGFLFTTAQYTWKSWKRKYARRNRLAPVQPLDETLAGSIDMEENLIAEEEARIVRELVDALPDKFKIPVILYYTIEMSVPDISTAVNLPVGTVKSRLFRARKLIEKGLVEYEK